MIDDVETDESAMTVTRTIRVPASVSPEARSVLAAGAMAGGDAGDPSPEPDDVEGWRAHVRLIDAMLLAAFEPQAVQLPCTVEVISVGGVPVFDITPEGVPDGSERICLDIHGGALIFGGGECCRAIGIHAAARVGMRTWSPDYRMPPDHPYPAALDDCLAVYREVLKSWAPDRIVVRGGSSGGNLAAALILRARDEGLPLPGALVLLSPEVDLTESGDSFQTNLGVDTVLTRSLADQNRLYAGGHDLTDPYVSPLFGNLAPPFPPTFLQTGTRDLFLSNTVRMHRKLRAAGVEADLHVFEAMPHGGFFGAPAPEDRELADEVRRFVARHVAE
jgi:monoterpene epsilon-lactone hydrolase